MGLVRLDESPGPICTDDVSRRDEAVRPLEIQFMKANRRTFVSTALGGGLAALPLCSADSPPPRMTSAALNARYRKLDEILKQPVLKKQLFDTPVIIDTVELLRLNNSFICRVRSRDGAEGISVAHSGMNTLYPIFLKNLQPFFIGKDARELDPVSYTHLRAHETRHDLVCRLLLEKKKKN